MTVQVKRVYTEASGGDGFRVLVDRLWPRGLSKRDANVDLWLRDVAPSAELRKWFAHDPRHWDEFVERYFTELERVPDVWQSLVGRVRSGLVTLLYAAKDEQHNNAVALRRYLEGKAGRESA